MSQENNQQIPDDSVKNAVAVLVKALSDDSSFYVSWHANVAMAFQDATRNASRMDCLHEIANTAAHNFFANLGVSKETIQQIKDINQDQLDKVIMETINIRQKLKASQTTQTLSVVPQ